MASPVRAWTEDVGIPTWLPAPPDRNPMFLEKRVYQGSSGRVYPLPFTDRIREEPTERRWKSVWLENEFLRVQILPELGGRIHALQDRTNGYDVLYRQETIKPALVGLAGPWISGGIEFNWPQHHRPATFLPAEHLIETEADGSVTVWCGDHDPMTRMRGLHGVCLRPGRAYLELRVRVHNRTPVRQTFLWWANVATRVHVDYQSFFPPDVYYVADHAKRAMSEYPLCLGTYYGVDYGARGRAAAEDTRGADSAGDGEEVRRPNDLSFYAHIPTPCSYMAMGSREDFFGGYDHRAQAGIIHIANHHISPGKKQWTWGNHPFGYAWDRNLTDATPEGEFRPYIELMAGVYTDNQPDFSFLQPGETRAWSQYWYPIQRIGPASHANLEAALSVDLGLRRLRIGVSVTRDLPGARLTLRRLSPAGGTAAAEWVADLAPGRPLVLDEAQPADPWQPGETEVVLRDGAGCEVLRHRPRVRAKGEVPPPATEPAAPADIPSTDELYVTGLHLEQYRHATRCPTLYWREALRRDPGDSRCNTTLGRWHFLRGEFGIAERHFRLAIERVTRRNPNPADGEPYYQLGLCLRFQADAAIDPERAAALRDEAYDAFYKATWNEAWAAASYEALARLDGVRGDRARMREHAEHCVRLSGDGARGVNLLALALRRCGAPDEAAALLRERLLARDPLDVWARHQLGDPLTCDWQTRLDVAHDCAQAGAFDEALRALEGDEAPNTGDLPTQSWGAAPLVAYTRAWLLARSGDPVGAARNYRTAADLPSDYCFPARLEEIGILEAAMRANPRDARAPFYLGNLLYDRRRHEEALRLWERSTRLDPTLSVVWRNLGIGEFNIRRRPARARTAYDRAFRANPADARLLFERDQLWKRMGVVPARRLRDLERHPELVRQRDDLSVELGALLNQTGRHAEAAELLAGRRFQPWEGGEGQALGQHVRTQLALGRIALQRGDAASARSHFQRALESPENLGEARHLLANDSDVRFHLGCALEALGDHAGARAEWRRAATFAGDFQEMSVRAFSEMTRFSALAWERLGRRARARRLFGQLLRHARRLGEAPARIDYFATSLPTMLLFEDDLGERQIITARFLEAQACLGLGQRARALRLLGNVLARDPSHAPAADLLAECEANGGKPAGTWSRRRRPSARTGGRRGGRGS